MQNPRIGIFIIAYNAVRHLTSTINRIPKEIYDKAEEIFIIDDCSTDNSYYAALGYKHEQKIDKLKVMRNETNKGYGGNQKIGYNYAIERGFDVVVMLHGDGQYAPEVLPAMLAPFEEEDADFVYGSRMLVPGDALRGGMPLYKYVGNKILSFLQNRMTGLNLSEYHSGYRAYSTRALKSIPFNDFTDNWHFDTQIILAMTEKGIKITERPIPTYYGDEICHVYGVPYALNCLKTTYSFYKSKKQ